jgi:hypothetical protein
VLVAVATSQNLAQLPPDDHALLAALGDLGILATAGIWSSGDTDWSKFGAVVVRPVGIITCEWMTSADGSAIFRSGTSECSTHRT